MASQSVDGLRDGWASLMLAAIRQAIRTTGVWMIRRRSETIGTAFAYR
jgi:hypothetical protein